MQHPNDHFAYFPPPPPLPPGWEMAIDTVSGRPYFANRVTGETRWDPPPHFPPPPPPPPPPTAVQPPPPPQVRQLPYLQQVPTQSLQPQMMYSGAQSVVAPQEAQPAAYTLPATNMPTTHNMHSTHALMQPNCSQPYPLSQPQLVANAPNPIFLTQQQIEPKGKVVNIPPSPGLGPSTAVSPGMLVPSVRAMINAEMTQKVTQGKDYVPPKLELEGLTAGAIADLCNVTKVLRARHADGGDFAGGGGITKQERGDNDEVYQPYTPLRPFELPESSVPPHVEGGRLDIRLHALHRALDKIG